MGRQDGDPECSSVPANPLPTTLPTRLLPALPGILRLRSQVLPMVAMEGACLRRVMLSFMRPSPVTFTVKGLPVGRTVGQMHRPPTSKPPRLPLPSPDQSLTWNVLVSKLDVDDVGTGLSGAVGDFACAIFHVLTVDIDLARAFDAQPQTPITCGENKGVSLSLIPPPPPCSPCPKLQALPRMNAQLLQ